MKMIAKKCLLKIKSLFSLQFQQTQSPLNVTKKSNMNELKNLEKVASRGRYYNSHLSEKEEESKYLSTNFDFSAQPSIAFILW